MLAGLLSKLAFKDGLCWNDNLEIMRNLNMGHFNSVLLCLCVSGPGIQRQGTADSGKPVVSSDCVCKCNETSDSLPSTSQSETKTDGDTLLFVFLFSVKV